MRILLVEDNFLIGDALYDHMVAQGWEVDWVVTLATAMLAVEDGHYAVVLLDLHLPDGSGFDLLRHMQETSCSTPVIILSAYDQTSVKIAGLESGAVDYMPKPFDLNDALARIDRWAMPPRRDGACKPVPPHAETPSGIGLSRNWQFITLG